jgi:putative thioredoxin
MDISPAPSANAQQAGMDQLIKDGSMQTFQADVIDASMQQPVLVDFWAPWCGPCKQLGPAIEKTVMAFGGRVKLVKINVDENQAIAGQMGVQSIPAVFAFSGGKPVDTFTGALPESQIQQFIQKQIDGAGAPPNSPEAQIKDALAAAAASLEAKDYANAAHIYQMVLDYQPDHDEALIGMATTQMHVATAQGIEPQESEATLALVSDQGQQLEAYLALRTALNLQKEAAGLGDAAALIARVEADPNDLQARYDLAIAYNASDKRLEAAEQLVAVMRKDRDWNEDAARKKLLELFEAWGNTDQATIKGRRLLSAALFA